MGQFKSAFSLAVISFLACGGYTCAAGEPTSSPAPAAQSIDFGPYMATLQKKIKAQWTPPKALQYARCVVLFKVSTDGSISDLKVAKSGGKPEEDEVCLAAVRRAAPFAPLPTGSPPKMDIQFTFDRNEWNRMGSDIGKSPLDEIEAARGDRGRLVAVLDNHGIRALNNNEFDSAISKFAEAVSLAPKDAMARDGLSKAFVGAAGSCAEHFRKGDKLLSDKQYDAALQEFLIVTKGVPRMSDAFDKIGEALLGKGDKKRAEESFRKALLVYKDDKQAIEGLKRCGVVLPASKGTQPPAGSVQPVLNLKK